jgi:hypothetical protein
MLCESEDEEREPNCSKDDHHTTRKLRRTERLPRGERERRLDRYSRSNDPRTDAYVNSESQDGGNETRS